MKPTILVTQQLPESVSAFLNAHCECRYWTPNDNSSIEEALKDVDGVMVSGMPVTEKTLSKADQLKVVSTISVGYNHLDLEAMKAKGVVGTHTPEVLDDTVADLVMALMLGTARRIAALDSYVKSGNWQPTDVETLFGLDVHHKKLGIIGMGRIGRKIVQRAKAGFDMSVVYHNRHRDEDAEKAWGIAYASMTALLSESDFVILMVPLTESTYGMMDAAAFKQMKKTAVFINASRGQTVDEAALFDAVNTGGIWGAGLDVFCHEPINTDSPLLKHPRILTVPHIGSATEETRTRMAMAAAESLVAVLSGKEAPYLIPEFKK
ncbi:D-glycerate dehydrogenase [Fusibacter paucivorans]|uniref:D-glycerate dehydrogenase n=1 Tax=Fusibacter paucivorans TaxID=76009 RepID=A0ABS5PN23_9FIRM|nr:D-glycerate dehydrogenase [Fusibacter paucivorans]MBS7525452.1 D-glycerate dehydrogenase [Fusibacter paucivorans]